jgi:hypothetical protein
MLGIASRLTSSSYPEYRTRTSTEFADTSNNSIEFTNHADFRFKDSDFSFSGWVKFTADATSTTNKDSRVVVDFGNQTNGGVELYYNDSTGDNEKIYVLMGKEDGEGGSEASNLTSATDIDHGQWYHFAFTYDDSATTGKLYIDGALDTTKTDQGPIEDNTASTFVIGGAHDAVDALQCEIIVWKGITLSASQILGVYNNGRPRHGLSCERSYIKGYWKLNADDDVGSNNVLDSSGNGHHGTTESNFASGDFDKTDVPS